MNGYEKCLSKDFNPFDNCKPVNCEEKYFGKRNFFNGEICVPAKICDQNFEVMYDYEKNECRNSSNLLDEADRKSMENGIFFNWIDQSEIKLDEIDHVES